MATFPTFNRPIAHRGMHDATLGATENSASAFDRAITNNFAIECDLQLTGDDKPVVFHDYELQRLTGQSGCVKELSAGQVGRIPLLNNKHQDTPQRFEEMLEQVDGRVQLVVELKAQDEQEATFALAQTTTNALKNYQGPVVVESFDPDLLLSLRTAGFKGHIGIVVQRHNSYPGHPVSPLNDFALRHMIHWPQTKFSFISSDKGSLDLPAVRFWRSRGLPVSTWTIKSQEDAQAAHAHSDQIVFEGFSPQID